MREGKRTKLEGERARSERRPTVKKAAVSSAKAQSQRSSSHSHASPLRSLSPSCSSTRHTRQPWNRREGLGSWRGGTRERGKEQRERLTNATEPRRTRKQESHSHCSFCSARGSARPLFPVPEGILVCSLVHSGGSHRERRAWTRKRSSLSFQIAPLLFSLSRRATDEWEPKNETKKNERLTLSEKRRQPAPIVRN